jgi:RES domain-containing protein
VARGPTVRRGGTFHRLAEPHWTDPLDTSHSRRVGGRWNAPGEFGVLYLNASVELARLQVEHKLAGHPYEIEDLEPVFQHDLVEVDVAEAEALDLVSEAGLTAAGLPPTYPLDANGRRIGHDRCQPVGRAAYADARVAAIACRSAAPGTAPSDEELALFDRHVAALATQTRRRPFASWYLG